ncbi:MAG: redoxin family protein [Bacteroidota bacterium]
MIKNILIIALSLFITTNVFGQFDIDIEIGDQLEKITLPLINAPHDSLSMEAIEDKVVIIDFWATWCSPCLSSMEHLEEIQKEFEEEVRVIAVSSEDKERIERFVSKREYPIWFGVDEKDALKTVFPYRMIPHTVVLDREGVIVAVTEPYEITSEVIKKVIKGKEIDLPLKEDNMDFDPTLDYFKADTNTVRSFVIQPAIPNFSTFSKTDPIGPFANRRISFHNFTIDGLYRHAYQTTSKRMVYEVDEAMFEYSDPKNKYCVDLIVAPEESEEKYEILQQKIHASFDVQARLEKRKIYVARLYKVDSLEFTPQPSSEESAMSARGDYYKNPAGSTQEFAEYLEGFGVVNLPVENETGIEGTFNFDFSFDTDDHDTFFAAMKKLGLGLKKVERDI